MTRWLGIDYGSKRIGVAVGDTADAITTPLTVLPAEPLNAAIDKIIQLADEYHTDSVVFGWPLNMDDTEGPQGRLARTIALQLAETSNLDVRMWDERLSSFEADGILAGKLTRMKKRRRQDAVAAAVILKDFLDRDGPQSTPKITDMQTDNDIPQRD